MNVPFTTLAAGRNSRIAPSTIGAMPPTKDAQGLLHPALRLRIVKFPAIIFTSATVLLLLVGIAFSVGQFPISVSDLLATVLAKILGPGSAQSTTNDAVIFQIRAPRIVAAMLIGAALSAAGAVYQNLFRNPLVSPDILGVSSGAALGAVLAIFLALPLFAIQGFAFIGGLFAVAMVYFIGNAVRGHDAILSLILTGVVMGAMLGAGISLLKYLADPFNQLPAITFWLLGSLSAISIDDLWLALPPIVLGFIPIFFLRSRMNVLSLSDDEAQSLGLNVARLRIVLIASATLITAASVAIAGIIGWIGLLIPHAARLLVGAEFSRLLPLSMLLGASFLLAVDTLSRTLSSIEIPPGVVTAILGTPLFLWLLAASSSARRD